MKPESRRDIIERHVAEAEAAVERQIRLIQELEADGHPTKGSRILLGLLEEVLHNAREAPAMMKDKCKQP